MRFLKILILALPSILLITSDVNASLLAANTSWGRIDRYDEATSDFIDTLFNATNVKGLAFGADGNLYAASTFSGRVDRYDGVTGDFIDTFFNASNIEGLAFGADGNLYAANTSSGRVDRYDGVTGDFIDTFFNATNVKGLAFDVAVVSEPDSFFLMILGLLGVRIFKNKQSEKI